MPMNRIQFQKGLSFHEFVQTYSTEDACYQALLQARWPDGFRCPRCGHAQHCVVGSRSAPLYQCDACRTQTSAIAGTLFENTKLPLRTWFQALYLLMQNKNNVSALELTRHLGVCYRTAWRLKHKLMQAMACEEEGRTLSGLVQIDDIYLGGECIGGKRGRGSPNKQAFLAAVSVDENGHPMHAVLMPVQAFTKDAVAKFATAHLAPDTEVFSDGLSCFTAFADADHAHTVITPKVKRLSAKAPSMRWVNTVVANLKRAVGGTYHSFRVFKYARRYLGEYAWRFNRRFDLRSLLGSLLGAAVNHVPQPERALRRQISVALG